MEKFVENFFVTFQNTSHYCEKHFSLHVFIWTNLMYCNVLINNKKSIYSLKRRL